MQGVHAAAQFQPTLPARGATGWQSVRKKYRVFQPTLPARGATQRGHHVRSRNQNFNPRSPHGERQNRFLSRQRNTEFQPTLPARGATATRRNWRSAAQFQPTLPARGATVPKAHSYSILVISTHAPRTGSDGSTCQQTMCRSYFNPRSPHGERQVAPMLRMMDNVISTHAPRTGSDATGLRTTWTMRCRFQPTLPARGATQYSCRPHGR